MQVFREERAARARLKEVERAVPGLAALCRTLGVDLVHSNSIMMLSGLLVAQQIKLPHVWHVRELFREHYGLTPDGGDRRFRKALRSSDAVVAISEAVAASLRSAMGREVFKLHRIHDAPFRAEELRHWRELAVRHQRRDGLFRFIQVGLFHPSKGQVLSLEAFAEVHRQFPDTRLVFVGDGQVDAVKDRIRELGLEDVVELKGFVPDAMPLFLDADCVLNPSRFEAFGRTTVEAMAVGVPVIGHASGATPELIAPGIGGQVFSGGHHELAACMRHYLEHPEVARDAGRRGMDRVTELFTMEPMLDSVMAVYRSLSGQGLQGR